MGSLNRQAPDIPMPVRGTEDGAEPDPARFGGSWPEMAETQSYEV